MRLILMLICVNSRAIIAKDCDLNYFIFVLTYIENSKQGIAGATEGNVESDRDQQMKPEATGE